MKTIRPIIWLATVLALLVALLVWYGKQKTSSTLSTVVQTNLAASSTEGTLPAPSQPLTVSPVQANPSLANVSPDTNATAPLPGSKAEQMSDVLSNYNDMPIVFYGKIEDQFSNAVANATVNFSVRINNGYEATTHRGRVASDAGGFFTISGYKGADLSVNPERPGYATASTSGGYKYSQLFSEEERAHPDPSSPVLIKMWKLQGAEPLVGFDKDYKLRYTDGPIYFDLLAGKVVPVGGDIKMTVSQKPGEASLTNQSVWNVRVEAVDGGLMDSAGKERTTYWAPVGGYQPADNLFFPTNVAGLSRGFFITSRNGQIYSKLRFYFRMSDGLDGFMYVGFAGVANTNGSRNWEGDPNNYAPR